MFSVIVSLVFMFLICLSCVFVFSMLIFVSCFYVGNPYFFNVFVSLASLNVIV
jgi:hypothetical protein